MTVTVPIVENADQILSFAQEPRKRSRKLLRSIYEVAILPSWSGAMPDFVVSALFSSDRTPHPSRSRTGIRRVPQASAKEAASQSFSQFGQSSSRFKHLPRFTP
jgi:hypothetical protein